MKDPSLSFDSFRKLLKTFLFDKWLLHERICGSCINLRGEMFIIIIIIIIDNCHESCNWIEFFCGICQMMPLKVWPNTALGCNHQSVCMPQLQPLCSAALVPRYYPEGMKAWVSPVATHTLPRGKLTDWATKLVHIVILSQSPWHVQIVVYYY